MARLRVVSLFMAFWSWGRGSYLSLPFSQNLPLSDRTVNGPPPATGAGTTTKRPSFLAVLPSCRLPSQCVGFAWLSLMVTQVLRAQTDSAVTTGWAWKPASRITAIITNPGTSVTAHLLSGPDVRKDPRR